MVLTLAVLFFTGSQARHLLQHDDAQSYWDRIKDLAITYAETLKDSGRDQVAQLEASGLAKQLNLKLLDNFDTVSTSLSALYEQFAPAAQEWWDKVEKETQDLRSKVNQDLDAVKEKAKPYLDEFQKKVQDEVEIYRQKVAPLNMEFQEKLRELQDKVRPVAEEMRDHLREEVEKLRQKMAPYGDDMRLVVGQRLEELKASSIVADYQNKASEHLVALRDKANPLLKDLQQGISPVLESIKTSALSTFDHLQKQLESQ